MSEQDLGHLDKAHVLLDQAIAIDEKSYEANHPKLAFRYNCLATVEQGLGSIEESRRLMRQAFKIWHARFGIDHYHTQQAVAWLAEHDPDFEISAG